MKLYVVTAISNPVRFKSRYALYRDFAKYIADSGAELITVEAAFGERPHAVTDAFNPHHLQVRTSHELWHKENLLNLGVARLSQIDPNWKYVAWVDADVQFARPDWITETLHQLQHHAVVQMFSQAHDLGPTNEVFDTYEGFAACYLRHGAKTESNRYLSWHPGYAWAWRREALDAVGGLIDNAILGSADQHMANALIGRGRASINPKMHPNYLAEVDRWESRAERFIRRNIGVVSGALFHFWHGKKKDRGYLDRWKILRDLQYDPITDLKRDCQGLWQIADDGSSRAIVLRDLVRKYFRARNEDSIDL
jgi:hypothetical protein